MSKAKDRIRMMGTASQYAGAMEAHIVSVEDDPCLEQLGALVEALEQLLLAELALSAAISLRDEKQVAADEAQIAYDDCLMNNGGGDPMNPPPQPERRRDRE